MASPLSSCFSLGFSRSRPRDGAVTGKCVLGNPAAVWEADSGGWIKDQVLPGGRLELDPAAGTHQMANSTFLRAGTTKRGGSSSNLLCHWLRTASQAIEPSSTPYPLHSALRTFPQPEEARRP